MLRVESYLSNRTPPRGQTTGTKMRTEFSTDLYRAEHDGRTPRGEGFWVFFLDHFKTSERFTFVGKFQDAKRAALQQGRARKCWSVRVAP